MVVRWDDIFLQPDNPFAPELSESDRIRAAVVAGITGWANCMMGAEPPKTFGKGMAVLAQITGCTSPDSFMEKAKLLN